MSRAAQRKKGKDKQIMSDVAEADRNTRPSMHPAESKYRKRRDGVNLYSSMETKYPTAITAPRLFFCP